MCLCNPCDERTVDFTAFKDAQFDADINDIDKLFGNFLQARQIPGGAVGIVRDNQIVVLRGLGLRSVSPASPYTVGTAGLVGSISKTLTALAMLVLAEENKVNFSKSINEYLPISLNDYSEITIPQLLSQTSGIENANPTFGGLFVPNDEEGLKATCGFALAAPFEHICGDPQHPGIVPRSAYYTYYANNTFTESAKAGKYSNINYMLLGTIIDMITRSHVEYGASAGYENFVWHRVCLEADMLSPCLMAGWRNIKNVARGYRLSSSQGAPSLMNVPYPSTLWGWEGPPGGWTMTIGDLCRLMIGVNRNRIIGQIARDGLLLKPTSGDLDVLELVAPYGHGVFVFDTDDEGRGYLHHGDTDGFTARFTYYQSHDVGVAVILNREEVLKSDIGQLSLDLRDRFSSEGSVAASPAQRRRQPCTAVERVLAEYEFEIARMIQDLNRGAVDIDRPNTAIARFLIATEGERGKRLFRQVSNRDYERAATTALEILEGRQPLPLDRPADWV